MSDPILTPEEWEAASMASMLPALVSDKERSAAARSLRLHDAALRSRLAEAEARSLASADAWREAEDRCGEAEAALAEAVELLRRTERHVLWSHEDGHTDLYADLGAFIEAHG